MAFSPVTPTLTWASATALTSFGSGSDSDNLLDLSSTTVYLNKDRFVGLVLVAVGEASATATGSVTALSKAIFDVTMDAGSTGFLIEDGQGILGAGIPVGATVASAGSTTLAVVSPGGSFTFAKTDSALEFALTEVPPPGSVAITVTPSTGVTLSEWKGSTLSGSSVTLNDNGVATWAIEFPSTAGTFTVDVDYSPGDANFASASGSLTVVTN